MHVCRFYIGRQAKVVIADAELLKQIMVKDFDTFQDRGFVVSMDWFNK